MLKLCSFTACPVPGDSRFFEKYKKMSHRRPGQGKGKTEEKPDALLCFVCHICIDIALQKTTKFHSAGHTQDTVQHTENTLDSQETKGSATY